MVSKVRYTMPLGRALAWPDWVYCGWTTPINVSLQSVFYVRIYLRNRSKIKTSPQLIYSQFICNTHTHIDLCLCFPPASPGSGSVVDVPVLTDDEICVLLDDVDSSLNSPPRPPTKGPMGGGARVQVTEEKGASLCPTIPKDRFGRVGRVWSPDCTIWSSGFLALLSVLPHSGALETEPLGIGGTLG